MTWLPVYYAGNILSWVGYLTFQKKRTLLTYCMSLHKCPLSKFLINESMMKPFVYIKPSGEWEGSLRSRYMPLAWIFLLAYTIIKQIKLFYYQPFNC